MKRYRILTLLALLLCCNHGFAQTGWSPVSMNASQRMNNVDFLTENIGYAMMSADLTGALTLEKTTNGGMVWTAIPLPVVGQEFQSFDFHADGSGVVVFRNLQDPVVPTRIYQTVDDGANWQDISPDSTETGMGSSVCQFLDADTGFFAAGQFLYSTVDGGANWTTQSFSRFPMSISFHDSQNGTIGTFDGTFGYLGGMLTTTDGGLTWSEFNLMATGTVIGEVGQLSPTVAFAAPVHFGGNGLHHFYWTTNSGTNWTTVQVPDTLPNSELTEVDFLDELNGMATVTEIGGVTYSYKTTDGGNSWTFFDSLQGLNIDDLELVGTTGYLAAGDLGVFHKLSLAMSINQSLANPVRLFPNPVRAGDRIRIEGIDPDSKLTLIDISGKTILQGDLLESTFQLPLVQPGIYFLRLESNKGIASSKLVIQ